MAPRSLYYPHPSAAISSSSAINITPEVIDHGYAKARPAPHSDAGVSELWIILDRILADHFRLDRLLPRIASSLCPFLPRRVLPSKPIASVLRVCSCSPLGSLRLACDVPTFPPRPGPAIEAAICGCLAIERHGP